MSGDPMEGFSLPTKAWFSSAFGSPTPVQIGAWTELNQGHHALVVAPTGSGKTLAAFLGCLDRMMHEERPSDDSPSSSSSQGVRVLYISPLKALGVDVERNLRVPLRGITTTALEMGVVVPQVRVGVRSGDTPSNDRRKLVIHPPDILITTPESVFLLLSSAASSMLTSVETVIVDEIHSLAGTKRGAHLAVSLERLDAMNRRGGMQRIGLSATVRPPERVARFLSGVGRDIVVVAPSTPKAWQLDVRVPVEDMTQLGVPARNDPGGSMTKQGTGGGFRPPTDRELERARHPDPGGPRASIWPYVEEAIFADIMAHRSTICFCNSRGVAEKLTNHLNHLYHEWQSGDDQGVIARTHHGSVSKQNRAEIETDLKEGRLRCVVATNSLELGIDMGAVDLVIQVSAPMSVASGLQRIGRGGHHVGAVSHGIVYPLSRSDLLCTTVTVKRMVDGTIEEIHRLVNPLDVLAQQVVSMCLDHPQTPDTLYAVVGKADCFSDLPRQAFDSVVDMLTGKYPSDDFTELRPRLAWDANQRLSARPGARRLVTTSGGTIPDRGLYSVFMAGAEGPSSGKHAVSRRVGELDEEMVYESRVGDVFTLGTSAWRIEEITPNQVIVSPVPGQTGRLPFWHGDGQSRPAELGHAIQHAVSAMEEDHDGARAVTTIIGSADTQVRVDESASSNLTRYVHEQQAATGVLPDERTILVERHRDDLGAWRVCVHCQIGKAVLMPWAMAIQASLRDAGYVPASESGLFVTDDGIVFRLGEVDDPLIGSMIAQDPHRIEEIVAQETATSSMFAAHFRQCAARALLLPRHDPGKRSPLWQQRLRSAHLLSVASQYQDFPIIAEAMRECLMDVFDMQALIKLLRDIASRDVSIVEVETSEPSPFARSLLFGYTGNFIYDPDQPLAERAAAASLVDPQLLGSLLGHGADDHLDEEALADVEARLQRLSASRHARTMESFWDLVRELGPLTLSECEDRCDGDAPAWLDDLKAEGRVDNLCLGGSVRWVASVDVPWVSQWMSQMTLERLTRRWVNHHCVVTPSQIASHYGFAEENVESCLNRLVDEKDVTRGRFLDSDEPQYISTEVLREVRRRTTKALRAKVKPVEPKAFASFLLRWQEIGGSRRKGVDGVAETIDQLAGYPVPASMLESVVLPSRVSGYEPAMLDELLSTGEVSWSGHGAIGDFDGWVILWPTGVPSLIDPVPVGGLSPLAQDIHDRLGMGGAWSVDSLVGETVSPTQVEAAIWELVWSGHVTCDSMAAVRALTTHGGSLRRPRTPHARRAVASVRRVMPSLPGRWFRTQPEQSSTKRLVQAVELELERYGVVTRGSILTETMTPQFFDIYKILAAMEEQGRVRRGLFIDGLGAAQFALTGAVDALREQRPQGMSLLASCDPANPWGAALAWPHSDGHRPTRKAGALVVLDDGWPVIYLEKGVHTLVTFGSDAERISAALSLVGTMIDERKIEQITVTRINGDQALALREWIPTMENGGFVMVPQGYNRRPSSGY